MGDASLSRLGGGANDSVEPRAAIGRVDSVGSAAPPPAPTRDGRRPHSPSNSSADPGRKTGRPRPANRSRCRKTAGNSRGSHASVTGVVDESAAKGDTATGYRACRDRPTGEVRVRAGTTISPGLPLLRCPLFQHAHRPAPSCRQTLIPNCYDRWVPRFAGERTEQAGGYRRPRRRTAALAARKTRSQIAVNRWISSRSPVVSLTSTAPRFSSRRWSFVVPGIGTIHGL